jgi:hypothetical protein
MFPLLKGRLTFLVKGLAPMMLSFYRRNMKVLEEKGIQAVIPSTILDGFSHTIAKAAKDSDIPVVTWQLGNYGYIDQPMISYLDIMVPDAHMVFGKGVARTYRKEAKEHGTELVPIGSAFLESARSPKAARRARKFAGKGKTVLFVTTNYYQNGLYISFPPPFSDNLYWRTQRSIMDALGKREGLDIIVKLHPSHTYRESPITSYARRKGYSCKFVRGECYFRELLPLADAIVTDFPTTTLLESLMTDKPVFVYGGHLKIHQDALEVLKKRVFYSDNLAMFTRMIGDYLSGKPGRQPDSSNKEFIRSYGTGGFSEGTAAERAAAFVKNIIKDRRKS